VTYIPVKGHEESGEETTVIEKRSLTRTELQQYRTEFAQRGQKDVTYVERIWSNGAKTVEILAAEMRQLAGMIENPHIHEGLLMALEACPEATRTLFAWITEAWRNTVPDMDMSSVEAEAVQWRNLDEAIKLVRKVGIL
jgi:hypothetical protein